MDMTVWGLRAGACYVLCMDYQAAANRVEAFAKMLGQSRAFSTGTVGTSAAFERIRENAEDAIRRQLPAVRKIADRMTDVDSDRLRAYPSGSWAWSDAYVAVLEILGELESAEELEMMFKAPGPTLSASGLHPWIWNAAKDLWSNHHHRQAVQDAYTKVETMARSQLGVYHLSGKDLWAKAFSTDSPTEEMPRLRFDMDPAIRDRWTSAHEGAQRFGMGCAQGIRNWAAHDLDEAEERLAIEYLAALSVLARWVESAQVEKGGGVQEGGVP